jgi:hypothetical protein
MSQLYISRSHVRKSLAFASAARIWITLASPFVALGLLAVVFPGAIQNMWAVAGAFVLVPLIVLWLVTLVLCRQVVKCPSCEASLWGIGTASWKPSDTKIKDEVTACPYCGAVFI